MTINISLPDVERDLQPKITVLGVGGSGGNAVNNMINSNLEGVDFLIANTDAQALKISKCKNKIQLGLNTTRGLGAGMRPDVGKEAAEEAINEITEKLDGSHMLFIAAGMGGGTGTGAAPVIAKLARERGVLTVGVVTKPFHFEGSQRMKLAEKGIDEIQQHVDTLLTIPNQNLFRIANEKTTFADAFKMADDVLYAGVRGVTDLMVQPGMINLDFSDVKTVMSEMGKAMMGTGEASGEGRAVAAAEAAIANPLIDDVSLKGAKGLIINITGGKDITLYEVDEAANRIKQEIDEQANIIYGTTCDDRLEGIVRVSIVATGIDLNSSIIPKPLDSFSPISIDNSVYQTHPKTENLNIEKIEMNDSAISSPIVKGEEPQELGNLSENINNNDNEFDNESVILDQSQEDKKEEQENPSTEYNAFSEDNKEIEISEQNEDAVKEDLNIEEKSTIHEKSQESNTQPTVRRLSLFDTVKKSDEEESSLNHDIKDPVLEKDERTEPVIFENTTETAISENINEKHNGENEEVNNNMDSEFSAEDSDLDNDFNQENEEELLDIPTFLRRQAN